MENIKVRCIPVRQAININTKTYKINRFLKENKIGLIVALISITLLSIYTFLIINFINLIKIIY